VAAAAGGMTSDAEADPVLHPDYAPAGCGGVNPVAIGVIIDSGVPLARVTSSYHDASTEKESATRTVLYLQKEQEEADHDFELVWAPQAGNAPEAAVFTESRNGTDYTLIMVMPPQPTAAERAAVAPMPRETVFVIDTSGSMQGVSMEQARQALLIGLATLTQRDRFNVVEFNSVTRPMWPDALPATPENVKRAADWVGKLRADGGTEMAGALTFALNGRETPGVLRQVVFITDGAVGNEDHLFKLIASRLGATRLFTVGIGSAPNSHFMTKAAQFGRGTFTYIGDLREVQEKMTKLFAKIESPVLKDVAIRWPDGTPVETFPARVPDLYLGEPIVVAAAHSTLKGTIVVSGMRGNLPWSVALTPSPDGEPNGVGALWARAKIASLMDELRLGAEEAAIRPAVLKIALEHHLVSRYTSLVAVDVTPTAPGGDKRTALVKASAPRATAAGELPQTDTESTLQIVLGLLALAAAGMVALLGRLIPAGGAASPQRDTGCAR
jgi:Ca-activated chloride channel family protein